MTETTVLRAEERFVTRTDWLESRHSFSFGPHYDSANVGFGVLVVNNDDVVGPGAGFDRHSHRDMEIVSWVLEGTLVHEDDGGNAGTIVPGTVQRMSAGRGIRHSERNGSDTAPLRFVQMWVRPDVVGVEPRYDELDVSALLNGTGWVTVASGMARDAGNSALQLHQAGAALHVARLRTGDSVTVPAAAHIHLFVATGSVQFEGIGPLAPGDSVRIERSVHRAVVAMHDTELLLWELHAS